MRNETWLRMMSGFVLVGIFAAGTLFGAGLMKWTAPTENRLPPPPAMHGGPVEAMKHELALDDAQVAKMMQSIEAHQGALEAIRRDTQDRVREQLMDIENDLIPMLTPEQQKRLEQWRARRPPAALPPPGMGRPEGPPPGGPPPGPPR
ncbi:MAG TPA: hypothetical protein VIV40_12670 [Kofleriaceae bacterium]